MAQRKPVICVYSGDEGGAPFWICRSDGHRVEMVDDLVSLEVLIDPASNGGDEEYVAAILDRSVSAARFLGLLTRLPVEFRGDVLRIDRDGSGTLSTCAIREGRILYRLDARDVAFYLDARFSVAEGGMHVESGQPALCLTA